MKKLFKIVLLLIYFIPSVSLAADIFFTTNKNIFPTGEDFLVQVSLDTKDKVVNAVEGAVTFSTEFLELKEIRDGNSSINFWIEKPHAVMDGKVFFSGITTGGFSGPNRFLFGMVFRPKKAGSSSIDFSNIKVLKNDGLGTQITTKEKSLTLSISKELDGSVSEDLRIEDINPPEYFNPFIVNDQMMFDGKYFIVFSTVDKGVGIDKYKVREGFWDEYVVAESPYLLKDQSLKKNIYIKAIDKYENERLVKINAQNPTFWLKLCLIFATILIVCFFSYIFYRKKYG